MTNAKYLSGEDTISLNIKNRWTDFFSSLIQVMPNILWHYFLSLKIFIFQCRKVIHIVSDSYLFSQKMNLLADGHGSILSFFFSFCWHTKSWTTVIKYSLRDLFFYNCLLCLIIWLYMGDLSFFIKSQISLILTSDKRNSAVYSYCYYCTLCAIINFIFSCFKKEVSKADR